MSKRSYLLNSIMIGILSIVLGFLIGAKFPAAQPSDEYDSSLDNIRQILYHIDTDYVDSIDLKTITDYGIEQMLKKLDPHSVYIPPEDLEMVESQLRGNFEGIGIEFNLIKDTVYVVTPLTGGPSEQVGILAGDKIVTVDGEAFAGTGLKNADVISTLRGPKGTEVILGVKRRSQKDLIDFKVVRDKIPTHSLEVSFMINDETGYMKVTRFAATTYDEFFAGLDALKQAGMQNLILDLRDNPGGYLDRAFNMADEVIPGNSTIVYTKSHSGKFDQNLKARRKGIFENGNLIVLINEGSASGSEIVAGAIQDLDRGLIIGRRSFGKGLVQQTIPLRNRGQLRLTTSRYYIPSGRLIQKPYGEGYEDYSRDQLRRYQHGEFFHADSIQFEDSLEYSTANGRKVYGGGGIMPDLFVPQDTSDWTPTLGRIYANNLLREFTFQYLESKKDKLESMGFEKYEKNFEFDEKDYSSFLSYISGAGIKIDESDLERSSDRLKLELKAFTARGVWGDEGFYRIYLGGDEIFSVALDKVNSVSDLLAKN